MSLTFPHKAKVISVSTINHNVVLLQITKPWKFDFNIGQAVDLGIAKPGYELAVAPFTIANVPTDEHLEFVIKVHENTDALTQGIAALQPKDIVHLSYAWDSYSYKGSGTFIAAGTGITPFLPIFSNMTNEGIDIKQEHMLIYANQTKKDVLYYKRLKQLFSTKLSIILSRTKSKNLPFGKIDEEYLVNLVQSTEQNFYICGPRQFEEDIKSHLMTIGVNQGNIQTGYKF